MVKILNNKLDRITAKRFRYIGPLVSLTSDLLLIGYINKILLPLFITDQVIYKMAAIQGVNPKSLSSDSVETIKLAASSSMSTAIFYLILYHIVIYILCMKNINWSKAYVKGYCFSAALLSVIEIIAIYSSTGRIYFITPLTMLLYFFVYYGYRYFRKTGEL